MPNTPDRFVPLAVIRHVHGVRGEVKIASLTSPADAFFSYALHDESGTPFHLTRTGVQPGLFICRIEGVTDRTPAEALKGTQLGAMRSVLGEQEDDALYEQDLIGIRLVDAAGETLGAIRAIVNYGASDIAIIDTPGGELMLPFASQYFPEDVKDGRLLCIMPETISGQGA